jgi:hypothetical protein
MTQEQADQYDATDREDAGPGSPTANTPDRTHLNLIGKETFGTIVANAAAHAVPALAPYISPEGKTNLS